MFYYFVYLCHNQKIKIMSNYSLTQVLNLLQTINQGPEISQLLLNTLNTIDLTTGDKTNKIIQIQKLTELATHIGDIEHTGDWDPYLNIELSTLNNIKLISGPLSLLDTLIQGKQSIGTYYGYYEYNITNDKTQIIITTMALEHDEELTISIPIQDITKITIHNI